MGRHERVKLDGFILAGPHDVDNPNSRESLHDLDQALGENEVPDDIPDAVKNLERTIRGMKKGHKVHAYFSDLVVAAPPLGVGWLETAAPKGGIQALKKALERAGYRIAGRCEEFETYG